MDSRDPCFMLQYDFSKHTTLFSYFTAATVLFKIITYSPSLFLQLGLIGVEKVAVWDKVSKKMTEIETLKDKLIL